MTNGIQKIEKLKILEFGKPALNGKVYQKLKGQEFFNVLVSRINENFVRMPPGLTREQRHQWAAEVLKCN